MRTLSLLAVATVAGLLVAACGGASSGSDAPADPHAGHTMTTGNPPSTSAKPAKPMTVQQLAAALGCQITVMKAADYRQGRCTVAGTDFVLLDFDTAEGQRAWLDLSEAYGGVYLVGERWALSGKSKEYLETLSATLGGTVEEGRRHG